jgi:hypothetical protein
MHRTSIDTPQVSWPPRVESQNAKNAQPPRLLSMAKTVLQRGASLAKRVSESGASGRAGCHA